jgi:hypothetical protein
MELISLDGLTLGSVLASVVASILFCFIGATVVWLNKSGVFVRQIFYATNSFFPRTLVIFAFSIAGAYALQRFGINLLGTAISVPLTAATTFAIWTLILLWRFAHVGLHAAQLSVEGGTDYEASLRLCKDHFWFLGTGASKLTSAKNFDETILRCKPGTSIRFLLSRPNNQIIADAAARAGVAPEQYRLNVTNSLRRLATIRKERDAKIEVRFYKGSESKDFEMFRMMFIDDSILLLSYNVYGRGDGRKLPQLVLQKNKLSSATDGFYYAYHSYYERLWESSDPWEPQQYV